MLLMTWTLARLGSRFNLLFEPHQRRVRHSALGRFLDRPLDLMVGLVEPDGTDRVLPFTTRGSLLYNPEQFERINSITYRGYSERYRLRFEFNVHSVFYPQNEQLCTLPAFYLEMRISAAKRLRRTQPVGPIPEKVLLFIRLDRPNTQITATSTDQPPGFIPRIASRHARSLNQDPHGGQIDLSYHNSLTPREVDYIDEPSAAADGKVTVYERIVSLNPGCQPDPDGKGLTLELPVTEIGSGIKWRLVWGSHCRESVLKFDTDQHRGRSARLRYARYWPDLDAVMDDAIAHRDDWLAHSRRFEKLIEQAPLRMAQRHLLNQSFQSFLSNTFWCDIIQQDSAEDVDDSLASKEWFSVWEGSRYYHSTVNVEHNVSLFYLAVWPRLLCLQLDQWSGYEKPHPESDGSFLSHDIGAGINITGQAYPHNLPIEENSNYLLMLQAYCHWVGSLELARRHGDLIERLARYLIWTDRDGCGFPTEGTINPIDDATPAMQYGRKQTSMAVKRVVALQAAGDLLSRLGRDEIAALCESTAHGDVAKIEDQAWLMDHYAVCVDRTVAGIRDIWTGQPLPFVDMPGWDAYSIYTGSGLLLPAIIGQPTLLDTNRLRHDLIGAAREALGSYGCGHSSDEVENVWVSQNLWRDHLLRYLGGRERTWAQRYWDLQVMSNTSQQSLGYCDAYVNNNLSFNPRGVTSFGYMLAYPRLVIDRLSPGGARISVDPDRHAAQRWPLLPLADWKAGKIPICVVDDVGRVFIEGESDPIIIHHQQPEESSVIG